MYIMIGITLPKLSFSPRENHGSSIQICLRCYFIGPLFNTNEILISGANFVPRGGIRSLSYIFLRCFVFIGLAGRLAGRTKKS